MSSKFQPKKQKRAAGRAGKAVTAGVMFAAAQELLASKSVVDPMQLAALPPAPALDEGAAVAASALAQVEAVAVDLDVPAQSPQAAEPEVSAELADLLAQLADGDAAAEAPAVDESALDEPVLLAQASTADAAEPQAAAPEAASAGTGAEAAAFQMSPQLALVGGLGLIGAAAALSGGGSSDSHPAPTTPPTPTEAPTHTATGRVIDGPVQHARVFYDADGDGVWDDLNGNGQWDEGDEYFTFTDDDGNFTLAGYTASTAGRIVVEAGGIDSETGLAVGSLIAAINGSAEGVIVSPLSLMLALNPGMTQADLAKALGLDLPPGVDLLHFDPIAAMNGTGANAALGIQVFAAQQQLYALVRAISELSAGADGVVSPAELQAALAAVGNALKTTGNLHDAIHAAVAAVVSDAGQVANITQAIQFSSDAIHDAYTKTTASGLTLAGARALVASGDTTDANYAAAVELLAGARAAASVSQSTLLTVVSDVHHGGTYSEGALQSAINNQVEHYHDVAGQLTAAQVSKVVSGGDDALDLLVQQLHSAGIEQISLSAEQVTTLTTAHHDLDFAAGTDVVVTGTSFLGAAVAGGAGVASLLGAADVAVALTGTEVTAIAGRSDASLDDLVAKLQGAGMDTLQLSAAQVNQLAHSASALDFDAGTAVDIGSNFLNGTASQAELGRLLGQADVTVHLTQQDVDKVVVGGDAALASTVDALHQAGMDVLALGDHEVASLAHAHLHLAAGTDVSVTGTHFLSAGTATDDELHALLQDANVTAHMTNGDLAQVLKATTDDAQLDALTTHLHDVGVDALALDAGQALALADAPQHFTLNDALQVQLNDALTLANAASPAEITALHNLLAGADVSAELDVADLRQLHLNSTDELGSAISSMEAKLDAMGVEHLEISDELADALAEAGVRFAPSHDESMPIVGNDHFGQDVMVRAQADVAGGDTAYLQASLQELQQLGADHVEGAGSVKHIELAMSNSTGTVQDFTLSDLPSFEAAANVDLVVTDSDLALLLSGDRFAENLQALSAAHVDRLLLSGHSETAGQLNAEHAALLNQLHLTFAQASLDQTQVQLLGLGDEPAHALDPFNKHPTQNS
ncbi:hypothetical protein [Azohydromonas lata]|uniref:EF-hand domain-containing protein n=1 Tax=Azohydromonas lata TaxID=45677 RepID=A0ABU5IN42_9BURK|nr:hypothetical protein [Azohydromonas lata]MDZ5460314.1 hypothetical protein [Azohydromonas lata]